MVATMCRASCGSGAVSEWRRRWCAARNLERYTPWQDITCTGTRSVSGTVYGIIERSRSNSRTGSPVDLR